MLGRLYCALIQRVFMSGRAGHLASASLSHDYFGGLLNALRRLASAVLIGLFVDSAAVLPPSTASAQASATQISGTIVSQDSGLGISGATLVLTQGPNVFATTTTNALGNFSFPNVAPGEYSVTIRATGYTQTRIESIVVVNGTTTAVRTPLRRAQTNNTGGIREIGRTNATSRATSVASTATIQYNVDPDQIQSQGFFKAADAVAQLPGVNLTGGPHTVGDDTSIDIRGLGSGEVRPLLDGHPIGPIGVYSPDYFNYNNTPYGLLDNINVTYGSGATGLYGVDVIGGTIDLQTLSPTTRPHGDVLQEFGNDGTAETLIKTTGSLGKFGYAVGHDVQGTYGPLAPGLVFQGARPNNNGNLQNGGACLPATVGANTIPDVTSCNTALNTYSVSANFKVLNDIAKLRYNLTPTTAFTVTAYDSNTHADSTGNGDNDYLPYPARLALIQAQTPTCPGGYLAVTDANPRACLTAQQLAAATSGPDGGGEDRNRGTSLQDFSARLASQIGINAISVSAFSDYYNFHKYSDAASGLDPTGTFFVGTGTYLDKYLTHGFLVTDDIATVKNDVGFGYYVEHQQTSGDNRAYDSTTNSVSFVPQPTLGEGDYSFFLRDNYTLNDKVSTFLNAWDRRSSVTQHTTLDPRVSLVFKPTAHDVVRLTAGQADGDPAASTVAANALSGITNPNSLNPTCNPLIPNVVASGGNPDLKPERSSDLEAGYGHRFWSDTSLNVVGYVSSVRDQIFSGAFPITPLALADPSILGSLAGFATKINAACGTSLTAADVSSRLGLSGYFNSASALYRGIEASGRVRVAPWIRFDYSYDIQSSQQFGEPANVLVNNPFILNGSQIYAIPVHKFNVGADYTGLRGYEAQLQLYYIGNNNTLNRPAYTYYNGFLSKSVGHNLSLTLSAYNLFNQNSQSYGYFGQQLPAPTNSYYTGDSSAIGQVVGLGPGTQEELFGLQPRLITLQINARF
jgi:outer membrane receptor protein involved in Fe transport